MKSPAKQPSNSMDIPKLLNEMRSPFINERMGALNLAQNMGAEDVEALIHYIQKESLRFQRRRKLYFKLAIGFGCIGVPLTILCIVMSNLAASRGDHGSAGAWGGAIGGILGGGGGGILGGCSFLLAPSPNMAAAANLLSQFDDLRAAGVMSQALTYPTNTPEVKIAIAQSLIRLLPRITPDTEDVLNAEQRASLIRYVRKGQPDKEGDLLLPILQTLKMMGETDAIPAARDLAVRKTTTPKGLEVIDAVVDCRKALEELLGRRRTGETLLRPSKESIDPSAILLRTVQNEPTENSELLLRPSSSETSS
jgi:hypothetical protein